ncbi:hypothetical protein AAT16_12320 [Salinicoccus halodurans]|uniref:Tryptophan synthase beta chain-like PALP domain-containing protein n=2 Tax=Salinicoccus halodurans TaxID=407035 RepID=A0ABM5TAD6_9STAP|nr:hypothetical protein AAT16_12320 [Salinicoccus halodurans]
MDELKSEFKKKALLKRTPDLWRYHELLPVHSSRGEAAVGVSKAKELGVKALAMPTNGNAGAAWSLYSAQAGITASIGMTMEAPEITRKECVAADADLLEELGTLAEHEGAFVCPEGAAAFTAARKLRRQGWIRESDKVVVLNTGAGIKYPNRVEADAPVLQKGEKVVKN